VLVTPGDGRADWLRAGQALHRVLAHAAVSWVFASLSTQPLEADVIRGLIRDRLALPGIPQMLLQMGLAHTTRATARRPRLTYRSRDAPRASAQPLRWVGRARMTRSSRWTTSRSYSGPSSAARERVERPMSAGISATS
jgi:hypothetical protein